MKPNNNVLDSQNRDSLEFYIKMVYWTLKANISGFPWRILNVSAILKINVNNRNKKQAHILSM